MTLISVEETPVTDQDLGNYDDAPDGRENQDAVAEAWDNAHPANQPKPNPHNHRYTVSLSGRDPMVVVRGETALEIAQGLQELEQSPVFALLASAKQAMGSYGPAPAAPMPAPMPQAPAMPQPAPGGWAAPAAPMAPPAPQGGASRSGTPTPPPGWYKIDVPYASRNQFKEYRQQNGASFAGKIKWHDKGIYFIDPSVVPYFQAYGPVPA